MKTRILIIALTLAAASCKARNERSDLAIISVIPPKASSSGTGATATVSCAFDVATTEFTELPYNPAENRGSIAAVVRNSLTTTVAVNPLLQTDSTGFLPHQAVVDYEFIPASAGTPPGETVIPAAGLEVFSGGTGTVGFQVFGGVNISVPPGTLIRVTMHIEGKLLDGSLVHTSEREYLFRFCTAPGCGSGGPWAADLNGTNVSCL